MRRFLSQRRWLGDGSTNPEVLLRGFDWTILRPVSWLVRWCFKPSQPKKIISGLRETFLERYIVERTNKAEIRPEEQREKEESCREKLWNEIQLSGELSGEFMEWNTLQRVIRTKQAQEQNKKGVGKARLVFVNDINRNIPTNWGWARGDILSPKGRGRKWRRTEANPRMMKKKKSWCSLYGMLKAL